MEQTVSQTVTLLKVVDGLEPLTYLTHAGDGTGRLYLVGKQGHVLVLEGGAVRSQPFLDITDRVGSSASEQGLLSIAFSPQYASDNTFFVDYTDKKGDTVISRFTAARDTAIADPNSESIILTIDQPYPNHNGGQLQFGPDGMLYIGTGDGGSGGDPQNNGQNVNSLLGKILRIDVSQAGQPYTVPASNPPLNNSNLREIWAYGLRNPWRFSFDRATGDLYIADVGQNKYEEIDFQPAGSTGGENYGWNLREGFEPYGGNAADESGLTAPIYQYGRDAGCSVTGGYVYRGKALPSLDGVYLYSDYCSGHIWSLQRATDGQWQNALLLDSGLNVSSFGEDEAGEIYVIDLGGAVYQLAAE
ncbi:MAG: PQQ-dependent sugar dehydrogenase [Chloroflexi bacterium]|nr:PQQ-dependent sugar dehydrogenase [Chloroflexota bacterium]